MCWVNKTDTRAGVDGKSGLVMSTRKPRNRANEMTGPRHSIAAWLCVVLVLKLWLCRRILLLLLENPANANRGFVCCAITFHFYGLSKLWWLTQLPSSTLWKDITAATGSCWHVSPTGTSSKRSVNLMGRFFCHLGFGWLLSCGVVTFFWVLQQTLRLLDQPWT